MKHLAASLPQPQARSAAEEPVAGPGPIQFPLPRAASTQAASTPRSIGVILVEAGRLQASDVDRIVQAQRAQACSFGQAGLALGLLSKNDVEFALSRQFDYPYLLAGSSQVHASIVTAYQPFVGVAEQLRSLRMQLMLRQLQRPGIPPTVAVVGGARREGRSFMAANLAVVFSQLGERTLLVDADLRAPVQAQLFDVNGRLGLSNILMGRADLSCVSAVPGLAALHVLAAGSQAPNPQELLARPGLSQLLADAALHYDVVVLDTPPVTESADAQIIAARVGMAVLVAQRGRTAVAALQRSVNALRDCGAELAGTVLNDA